MQREIRPGQIWKEDASGESWLVTKVYTEAFDAYASLRKFSGDSEETRRLRIVKGADGAGLEGFTLVIT